MFATLLGGLPNPDPAGELEAAIEAVIRAQEEAGLEPITDGRLRDPGFERWVGSVEGWRFAASLTNKAVKQALPGPYTLGRHGPGTSAAPSGATAADATGARAARTMAFAGQLRRQVETLAAAGCAMVEIEETEAHLVGEDEYERALFREAHARVTEGIEGTHLSLSIVGKAAWSAGIETIVAAPYASLAVDLINGPDNWNLVTRTPGDRGIVVGALGNREAIDEPNEVLLWGANYAASTKGRGLARVGLGSAGSYVNLPWVAALRKIQVLGNAARLAELPPAELAKHVDPQSISAKSGAIGRPAPKRPRRC